MGVKNRHLYQGSKKEGYFEGWYFKHVNKDGLSLSVIPGISKEKNNEHAFIQIVNLINHKTYYLRFELDEFTYSHNPFYVKIANNYFSLDKIELDIKDPLIIKGSISYHNLTKLKTSLLNPNIMGIFGYLPFMECNHCLISLKHQLQGSIQFEQQVIDFNEGIGYIEKDYGYSFPKKYLWFQSNNSKANSSLFFSYAHIPFKILSFKGLICIFEHEGIQYSFATYNRAKVKKFDINDHEGKKIVEIILKKGNLKLVIKIESNTAYPLIAPIKGKMSDTVYESLDSFAFVQLYKDNELIVEDSFESSGLEIFGY